MPVHCSPLSEFAMALESTVLVITELPMLTCPAVRPVPRVYQTIVWSASRLMCAGMECQEENGRLFERTAGAVPSPVPAHEEYTMRGVSLELRCRLREAEKTAWPRIG